MIVSPWRLVFKSHNIYFGISMQIMILELVSKCFISLWYLTTPCFNSIGLNLTDVNSPQQSLI